MSDAPATDMPVPREEHAPPPPEWVDAVAQLFAFDVLTVRQKLMTISQKYYLEDAQGVPRFFVERPPRLHLQIALNLMVGVVRLAILIGMFTYFVRGGNIAIAVGVMMVTNVVLAVSQLLMAPYRHIEVFSDETQSWRVLTISQDNKLALWQSYTIYDAFGYTVAQLRRHTLWSLVRRRWRLESPDGELLGRVLEDSWIKALLRRYFGPMYGLLRTNFLFVLPTGEVAGRYDRQLTLLDQYVLDLSGDVDHRVDRRVAVAMAVLLDSAEGR